MQRGALGLSDGAGLDVIGLREELIDEDLGIEEEAGYIRPDRVSSRSLALDGGAYALSRELAAVGHGTVAPVARPPGPGTAEGEAAYGAADEGAKQVGMARVAGQGAVALESSDGGVPDVIGNQRGNRRRDDLSDHSASWKTYVRTGGRPCRRD